MAKVRYTGMGWAPKSAFIRLEKDEKPGHFKAIFFENGKAIAIGRGGNRRVAFTRMGEALGKVFDRKCQQKAAEEEGR